MMIMRFMIGLTLLAIVYILAIREISTETDVTSSSCELKIDFSRMSSKTSYQQVISQNVYNKFKRKKSLCYGSHNDYKVNGCKQVGYWHISRHGQRYPDQTDINDINESLKIAKERILNQSKSTWLCDKDKQRLSEWQPRMKIDYGDLLTPLGHVYMEQLGERMRMRLADLTAKMRIKRDNIVLIQSTMVNRTIESAKSFVKGFFGKWYTEPVIHTIDPTQDYLLKFPDLCDQFYQATSANKSACPETLQFDLGSFDYSDALKQFGRRLGLELFTHERDSIREMAFKACQYEYLIDKTESVWCKYFDTNLLKLLEYREDLKYHCKYAYRHPISQLMTCDLIDDFMTRLSAIRSLELGELSDEQASEVKRAMIYFTHSSTMLPFYAVMGLNNDKNNFDFDNITEVNPDRSYRISKIDPMNTNIAFVLYKCPNERKRDQRVTTGFTFKLRAFQNEKLVQINGCENKFDCDLNDVLAYFQKFKQTCVSTSHSCKLKA